MTRGEWEVAVSVARAGAALEPTQPAIEAYLDRVADAIALRPDGYHVAKHLRIAGPEGPDERGHIVTLEVIWGDGGDTPARQPIRVFADALAAFERADSDIELSLATSVITATNRTTAQNEALVERADQVWDALRTRHVARNWAFVVADAYRELQRPLDQWTTWSQRANDGWDLGR